MSIDSQQRYFEVQIRTATPDKLITMLYDGAIRFLRQSKAHLTGGNLVAANNNIIRARDIIMELMESLDLEQGEIADNLYQLYQYTLLRLIEATSKSDAGVLDEILGVLVDLRETWVTATTSTKGTLRKIDGDGTL